MASGSSIFIAGDGDGIGRLVGSARLRNDVAEIRRVSQAIDRGNLVFTSWAIANGGQVIEAGGDEFLIEVPTSEIGSLASLRSEYEAGAGATVSIGVGNTVSEASKALMIAKLRGRDRVEFWIPEMQKEIKEAESNPKSEEEKLSDEYLGKAEGSAEDASGGMPAQKDHAHGPQRDNGGPPSQPEHPAARAFHAHAQAADARDRAAKVKSSTDWDRLKSGVVAALGGLREQMPAMAKIKEAAPQTYAAIVGLTNSVVELARGVQQQEQQLEKAMSTPKIWRENTHGFGNPIMIPGKAHPSRADYDANYHSSVAQKYANGDAKALKFHDLPVEGLVGPNSGGVANPDRFALYRRMMLGGDRPPPIVVQRQGSTWKVLDGTHRIAAARDAGTKTLPAVEIPTKKEELEPSETAPSGSELEKDSLRTAPYKHLHLPVGSTHNGKVKVAHGDGTSGWRSVRAGQIQSVGNGEPPTVGQNGHPVSSREPDAR
jgi:hypothetical protein